MNETELIPLFEYIPKKVLCGEKLNNYDINLKENYNDLSLSYVAGDNRERFIIIPKFINKNNETFEVLGLLQAEMGKTQNGCLVFCNHECRLIKKVMNWFKKEFELPFEEWKWYIKVNINEPNDATYKKEIENRVINYWLSKTKINEGMKYPKVVSYIKNTQNKLLCVYDYGTLIIEYKSNLFSQIIKNFVKIMFQNMINFEKESINFFMRGIIAGEGCVENDKIIKKYRVHISASKEEERERYYYLLKKLDINSNIYRGYNIIISKRENLVELLKYKMMCLSKEKYTKFLNMMQQYSGITEETGYFNGRREPWNKIPKEKIDEIIKLYNSKELKNKEIAERLGISYIKVQRVLKENNLGKRVKKIDENLRKDIAKFVKNNPTLNYKKIAETFKISTSAVGRAYRKYH